MKPESIQILEKHAEHWRTLSKAGYVKHLDHTTKKELEKVYQDEIDPTFHGTLWCGECVVEMIRKVYTRYEKWQEEDAKSRLTIISERKIDTILVERPPLPKIKRTRKTKNG